MISTDLKKQQESSFWKAWKQHATSPSHFEHLDRWKKALVKVAKQSGYFVDDHTYVKIMFLLNLCSLLFSYINFISLICLIVSVLVDLLSFLE